MKGHIRAASPGKWRVFIHIGKGRYQSHLFTGGRRDAERYAAGLVNKQSEGMLVKPSKITLGEYLDRWIAGHSASPRTCERYGELIRDHIKPALGAVALGKLSGLAIKEFYKNAQRIDGKGKLSKTTVLHIHTLLHKALRDAVELKELVRNPTDGAAVRPPRDQTPGKMRTLDAKQTAELFQGFKGSARLYVPTVVAATTGVRRGELLALRWTDLTLDGAAPTLTVERAAEQTKAGLTFKTPKTNSSLRTVDLLPVAVEALRKHAVEQKRARLAAGPHGLMRGWCSRHPTASLGRRATSAIRGATVSAESK